MKIIVLKVDDILDSVCAVSDDVVDSTVEALRAADVHDVFDIVVIDATHREELVSYVRTTNRQLEREGVF